MKEETKKALQKVWEKDKELCDTMASAIERREGWDSVVALWGSDPGQEAWAAFQEAFQAEWG